MWKAIRSATVVVALLALTSGLSGCNKKTDKGPTLTNEGSSLNPVPADPSTVDAQLQRSLNQTAFLNYSHVRGPWALKTAALESAAAPAGGGREIQESDVFKSIKGEKLLLLLNNSRGIQTVSFKKGLAKPELIGRSGATGNYSEDMYYDADNKLVYVLERYWYDESDNDNWSFRNSRILTYALDKNFKPTLKKSLEVKGEIAQHKMVGKVLYVATTEWPNWWGGGERRAFGNIFSFKAEGGELKKVAESRLTLAVSGRENLNIIEVPKAGAKPSYYLIAVLAENPWQWWDRKNAVEVVDISDDNGAIKPVMLVTAKGAVNEKTNTFIKNDTLVVVSNYTPDGGKARIAVETFRFPSDKDTVLNEDEALLRTQYLKVALARLPAEEREAKYNELVVDPKWGLRNVVIHQVEKDSLTGMDVTKIVRPAADSLVSVGDTQGLNAVLQDVRVLGNQLYAFWVPQNNIDPLDVFDLSAPEKEVKHLGFTNEIEGWVERSQPVEIGGRNFIIGLGWTIPRVNNDANKRYPQAVLFEVKASPGKVKVENLASLVLDKNPHVYTNFNSADKFVEFRMSENGKRAVVLFRIDSWAENSFGSGGQLLEVDLEKALAGRKDEVFKEGAIIAGGAGWLRRVFTNPEFADVVNTFNDRALGTFQLARGIGEAGKVERALSVLELARNIQGYVSLAKSKTGIQIISNDDDYYGTATASTSLRVVPAGKADAEKTEVKAELEVKGPATSHLLLEDDSLLLLGVESKWEKVSAETEAEAKYKYYTQYTLSRAKMKGGKLELAGTTEWVSERQRRGGPIFFESARMFPGSWWGGYGAANLIKVDKGGVFVNTGTEVLLVEVGEKDLTLKGIDTKTCNTKDRTIALEVIDGKLFATSSEFVEDPTRKNTTYSRNFIAPATLNLKEGKVACEQPVNIPGKAVHFTAKGELVTEDSRVESITERREKQPSAEDFVYYEFKVQQVLSSLKPTTVGPQKALSLTSIMTTPIDGNSLKVLGDSLVFMEQAKPYERASLFFVELEDGAFRETNRVVALDDANGNAIQHWQLAKVVPNPKQANTFLGILVSGRRGAVVKLDPVKRDLEILEVQAVNVEGKKAAKAKLFTILDPWSLSYGDNDKSVHFTEKQRSFEISQGMHGVSQIYLAD